MLIESTGTLIKKILYHDFKMWCYHDEVSLPSYWHYRILAVIHAAVIYIISKTNWGLRYKPDVKTGGARITARIRYNGPDLTERDVYSHKLS